MRITSNLIMVILALLLGSCQVMNSQELLRETLELNDEEREYYVYKSPNFNSEKTGWLIVVVHGGNGNGKHFFLANNVRQTIDKSKLNALVISPSFSNIDFLASRFPILGEGEFLKQVIRELKGQYKLNKKILLVGYSRGGQFSHRFALQNPNLVKACASFSSGSWTTPKGELLIESLDVIDNPKEFLSTESNKDLVPKRLRNFFQPRVAEIAGLKASEKARKIPFLVMCGRLDPTFEIAQQFALSLENEGYRLKVQWPNNPHNGRDKYPIEFKKYGQSAVRFFEEVIYDD